MSMHTLPAGGQGGRLGLRRVPLASLHQDPANARRHPAENLAAIGASLAQFGQVARPIRNHGGKGDDVYDPFIGSGTTLIACEQLGRKCFAIEIEPLYVDVAIRRWQKLTGKQATLEGKAWEDVAAERGGAVGA